MKIIVSLMLTLAFFVGCKAEQAYPDKTSGSTYPLKGDVKTVVLGDEIRAQLGVEPGDFVIAVKQDGSKILYEATNAKIQIVGDEEFPSGKTLIDVVTILITKDSPQCYYYWDGRGNIVYYPRPDCPHQ